MRKLRAANKKLLILDVVQEVAGLSHSSMTFTLTFGRVAQAWKPFPMVNKYYYKTCKLFSKNSAQLK